MADRHGPFKADSQRRYVTAVDQVGLENIVEDTTPQLGGQLDLNNQTITQNPGEGVVIWNKNNERLFVLEDAESDDNYLRFVSNDTTPSILVGGDDSDVNLLITAKNSGLVQIGKDLDTNSQNIRFDNAHGILDDSANEQLIFSKTASATNHFQMKNASVLGQAVILSSEGSSANMGMTFQTQGTGSFRFEDEGGDEIVQMDPVTSGVNHLVITQASTGNGPTISVDGSDTNIDLEIETKGTGEVLIRDDVQLDTNIKITGGIRADYDPGGAAGTFTLTDQTGTTGSTRPAIAPPTGFTTTAWAKVYLGTTQGYLVVFT